MICERNIIAGPQPGTWPHKPGMCPDWAPNQRPVGLQADAQFLEPHQPGLKCADVWPPEVVRGEDNPQALSVPWSLLVPHWEP